MFYAIRSEAMTMISHVYVLIRTDIPRAQQLVQACHATFEMGLDLARQHRDPAHLVALAVPDKDILLNEADRLRATGIRHRMFFEPDDQLGFTALATEPLEAERRVHLRHLPLWTPA